MIWRAVGGRRMLIRNRPPKILSGREFTVQEIQDIQETVDTCGLPWTELVYTICEHLDWVTPTGRYKERSCVSALRRLEALGLIKLLARQPIRRPDVEVVPGRATDPEEGRTGTVRDVAPLQLELVLGKSDTRLWSEYVARYHPLGYRRPFGAHQRYFLVGKRERRLGCLLFAAAAWALAERDRWIGWSAQDRAQRVNWVVANTRFLLFPWVRIKNLASKALSLAAERIRGDWQQRREEELKRNKQARREARRKLRERQAAEGLEPQPKATIGNGKSEWETVEEEKRARQETTEEQLRVYRCVLPRLLKRLAKIPDPRNPVLIRHKLTCLLLYGILMFVYQMSSRREANREMSLPQFWGNLRLLFPELESLPHQDTLARLLA